MAKIFPVPPILFASCFAWFFILFATTTNNALVFATFINPSNAEEPQSQEWLTKFIACVAVLVVASLHYRFVNIGILSNMVLAAYKVTFLGILTAAGFFAACRDGARHQLRGLNHFAETQSEADVSATNVILAILQVLYSFQGWENASEYHICLVCLRGNDSSTNFIDYVTSEIKGSEKTKKKTLKRGALIAIAVVNVLYILFNLFMVRYHDSHPVSGYF